MRSYWSDPYLWIHFAGLASLPLWVGLCLLGFAVGEPILPVWLELGLIGVLGIAPILWMQFQQPFSIYSLVAVTLKPTQLTEEQRKLLTLFKSWRNRALALVTAVLMAWVLYKIYVLAPIATPIVPGQIDSRWLGLLLAAIAFLGANLFAQVPVSVLSVLLTGEKTFAAIEAFPAEQIRQNFTLLGLPVNQILPPIVAAPPLATTANATSASPSGTTQATEPDPWSESAAETVPSEAAVVEAAVVEAADAQTEPISASDAAAPSAIAETGLTENSVESSAESSAKSGVDTVSETKTTSDEEISMLGSETSEGSEQSGSPPTT